MIDLERLVLLALDELDDAEAAEVDEHVLACGACASTLERLLHIGAGVRDLVRAGRTNIPVTTSLAAELRATGLISRSYHLAPDEIVPCTVGADDVYALTTLDADFRGVDRVDMVMTTPGGARTIADLPFDRERGQVSYVAPSSTLRTFPSMRIKLELFSVEGKGPRKLGEYFLEHTAFSP